MKEELKEKFKEVRKADITIHRHLPSGPIPSNHSNITVVVEGTVLKLKELGLSIPLDAISIESLSERRVNLRTHNEERWPVDFSIKVLPAP